MHYEQTTVYTSKERVNCIELKCIIEMNMASLFVFKVFKVSACLFVVINYFLLDDKIFYSYLLNVLTHQLCVGFNFGSFHYELKML